MDNNGKVLMMLYEKAGDILRWYLKRMLYLPRKASDQESLSADIKDLICIKYSSKNAEMSTFERTISNMSIREHTLQPDIFRQCICS